MTDADVTRLAGKESDATRLSVGKFDATRLAGESYRTRIVPSTTIDDQTRIAEGSFQSKLTRDAAVVQSDTSELYKVGDMIGDRYEVSAIHHGAMGVVYGCFDHQTKLPRALKTVRSQHMQDKQVLSQFESEAAVWISLEKHPYIVRAYLVERFNNLPYVITEYVRGPEGMEGDLRGWLGHPRLTLTVAVAMALQIAQGMQHAVRKVPNLVHRDLKPANILVNGDGKAMVTDFGLVDSAESGAGTPAYMSPEQWREDVLDARSVIYAYGCILFEMFTGHRLFSALTEGDWEIAHRDNIPAALTSLTHELPSEIDQFVHGCLEKEPIARPQNWDEIVTFFAEWYHRLTGKAVILDFSSLDLDVSELIDAGQSLMNLRRHEEMLSVFDRALSIDTQNSFAWMGKAIALCHFSRLDDAIEVCNKGLAANKKFDNLWCLKGMILNMLNRFEDEISAYDQALKIDQNNIKVWWHKSCALRRLKRYEEAIQACNQALTINQNDVDVMHLKGLALYDLKRYEAAIEAFDQIILIDQNNPAAWHWKGMAVCALNRYEEAMQCFDRAPMFDQSYSAWCAKGGALFHLKRYEDALYVYTQAIAIQPNAMVWSCRGMSLHYLKRYEDALLSYEQALTLDQSNPVIWRKKGLALLDLNRFDEAIQAEDRALSINPNYFDAWLDRGDALCNLMRYEEAISAYDHALAINASDANAIQKRNVTANTLKIKLAENTLKPAGNSGFSWAKFFGK